MYIVPDGKVLIEVLPNDDKPGLVVGDRSDKPFKGKVKGYGDDVESAGYISIYDTVFFRYYMAFPVPSSEPEIVVVSFENIELIERS